MNKGCMEKLKKHTIKVLIGEGIDICKKEKLGTDIRGLLMGG
jgi:hypothetical protein